MADNKKRRVPQQNGQQPSGPRRWLSILFYTIAFALMGFYLFGNKDAAGASKELSYTKLTAYIEAGAIDKIEVTDDLQAKATVKPQSYTLVFGTQGDGERAKGILRTQVPSIDEFSKYIEGINASRKADGQAAIDVKYDKSKEYWNNFTNYSNPQFDEIFAKAKAAINPEEKVGYYKQLQQILADDAASIYVQDPANQVAIRNSLTGYVFYPVSAQDMSVIKYK